MALFTAQLDPPHLEAIAPLSVIDATATTLYPGGILNTGFAVAWAKERVQNAEAATQASRGQSWTYQQIQKGDQLRTVDGVSITAPDQLRKIENSAPNAPQNSRPALNATPQPAPPSFREQRVKPKLKESRSQSRLHSSAKSPGHGNPHGNKSHKK